jgi:uncharacterized protein YecT (DUF1311 family)
MKKITLLLFLFFTVLSFSQTGEEQLYAEYRKAEKELETVYKKLESKLKASDQKELKEAQVAWEKYRDLNCKFISRENSEGGVIANKMKIDCLTESTRERITELEKVISDY